MKSDFYTAITQIAAERGIPREAVLSSVDHALKSVYKKMANTEEEVEVEIDPATAGMRIFAAREVVETVEDPLSQISLAEAQAYAPNPQIGSVIRTEERTPENFGRIAAQTVKQVVLQRIRDFERDSVYGSSTTSRARSSTVSSSALTRALSSSSWARPRRSCPPASRCRTSATAPGSGSRCCWSR
jgi:hypothetical protein